MNNLTWKPLTHNNPFTLEAGIGWLLMPQENRASLKLPINPNPGDMIGLMDVGGTLNNQPITLDPGNIPIDGKTGTAIFYKPRTSVLLVFSSSPYGWINLKIENPVYRSISDEFLDSFTINTDYWMWIANPTSINKTITLPPLTPNKGLGFVILNISSAAISLHSNGSELINGSNADFTLDSQSQVQIVASGHPLVGWVIITVH